MAYRMASLMFFNNWSERVWYSWSNPMSCVAQSGSSFHDPIPPNTSARLAASKIWSFSCDIGGNCNPYFLSGYSPIPSRRFFAEWKIWAKPSHRIWKANFSISDNACRKESVLFSKRGFSDGESGQRYSEYSVFHSCFSGSNCQFGAK